MVDEGDDLTPTAFVVLGLVAITGPATSYRLKQAAQASIGNFWSFPHSQLYVQPQRLADRGLLEQQQEEGGRRRRTFRLTDAGRAALHEWLADPHTQPLELRDEALLKLAFAAEASTADLRNLAKQQQQVQKEAIADYDELARSVDATGEARFTRATLEMGRRYSRLACDFWRDVETLADTGRMPTLDEATPPQR